jgi:NADPH2:quinone reductase
MKAVRIHQFGGPEVLQYEDVPIPETGPGQVLVKLAAAGLNYIVMCINAPAITPTSSPMPWVGRAPGP